MELLWEQKKLWPDLTQGYESLNNLKVREVACNDFSVRVQHNTGRIRSTLADVREKSINDRPCFLCVDNLPADQKGILYNREFLILCNPMPVFAGHFTIAHIVHQPQVISEHIDTFLKLMTDFGSRWLILYNGPKCGASAPDHLHFQAIPSGSIPIEKEIKENKRQVQITSIKGIRLSRIPRLGRELVILEGDNPSATADVLENIVAQLQKVLATTGEPMMNIAGCREKNKWRLVIFPRAKHRPEVFFKEGDDRIVVSPAVIEMGGVLVTPMERDFERLDAPMIESIFREVSLSPEIMQDILETISCRHSHHYPL